MNLSPAMIGLLQSLPPWNKDFPKDERKRWLAAFEAVMNMDYPDSPASPVPPPVSNDFVAPGCEQFGASHNGGEQ